MKKCGCNAISESKCLTQEQIDCAEIVYYIDYKKNKFYGECDSPVCPLQCNFEIFEITSYFKNFPKTYYAKYLLNNHSTFRTKNDSNITLDVDELNKNIARINIFYENLSQQLINEVASITIIDLLANIGGMLGN